MAKQLSYDEIKLRAGCGWRVRDLAEILAVEHPCDPTGPLGDFDSKECRVLGTRLMGIESVLGLLAQTPNAYVNREALDELQTYVTRAAAILSHKWVRELLSRTDEILGRDKEPNHMPF